MSDSAIRLTAPSRLHFGLLAWGKTAPRQFGSVGLMVDRPGLSILARPSEAWGTSGPLERRTRLMIDRVVEQLHQESIDLDPCHFEIKSAPDEHVGLGTGTQLSLSVAKILLHAAGEPAPTISRLVTLTGRGRRSGIGLHGFLRGGLLVDGGRGPETKYPPLLTRLDWPDAWSILVLIPPIAPGLSDNREREAFSRLPDLPLETTDRLCRLLLLGLMPAVEERDLAAFGEALSEIQHQVGLGFTPAQGGIYADPQLEAMSKAMSEMGLVGIGQSSWGPTIYGFGCIDETSQTTIHRELSLRFLLPPGSIFWTRASAAGARIESGY
jgi:beta-ribofuranosylaminobenzene 5'-phosphate synthase